DDPLAVVALYRAGVPDSRVCRSRERNADRQGTARGDHPGLVSPAIDGPDKLLLGLPGVLKRQGQSSVHAVARHGLGHYRQGGAVDDEAPRQGDDAGQLPTFVVPNAEREDLPIRYDSRY